MSAAELKDTLQKLVALHLGLYKLAKTKTEQLTNNDMEGLTQQLKEERKYVKTIQAFDAQLKEIVKTVAHGEEGLTLQQSLSFFDEKEQQELTALKNKLTETIEKLKAQNDLNQQLIQQSKDFIDLTIDLLVTPPDSYNYDRPDSNGHQEMGRSIFDSKA